MSPVEMPAIEVPEAETGNLLPLLHEIRHALRKLLGTGEETTIDLRALPLAPGEESRLEAALGEGEVKATLDALGESRLVETRYSGVWRVTHFNAQGETIGKYIEIARVPSLLQAQKEEMQGALDALDSRLQSISGESMS